MTNKTTFKSFVQRKIELLDVETAWSHAMCAKLRRGIGKLPGDLPEIWGIFLADIPFEWISRDGEASKEELAIYTSLTLYAMHRQGKNCSMSVCGIDMNDPKLGYTFGSAVAQLVELDESNLSSVKRRFDTIATSTSLSELAYHARGLVQLFKASDIKLDYPKFAWDLFRYQLPNGDSRVRLRWGEDFYRMLWQNNNKDEGEK